MKQASQHTDKLWVKKSNDHRGIRVENIKTMNLSTPGTFVQEFIQNPLLIDGRWVHLLFIASDVPLNKNLIHKYFFINRKFDIGIYVIMTSINPLRLYAFDSDALLRFCAKDYLPFNSSDVNSYVVGDDYTPIWEVRLFHLN